MRIDIHQLYNIMRPGSRDISRFLEPLNTVMEKYAINTPLRVQHFLAQLGHESGSFIYTQEIASGAAYEGRGDLGNIYPGDGKKFKGRGLIQLTGRANYIDYGQAINIDLTLNNNWLKVAELPYSVDVAGWFWNKKGLNKFADNDDIVTITRRINGGTNGLSDRQNYLLRAKTYISNINSNTEIMTKEEAITAIIKDFQQKNGLEADGKVGPKTIEKVKEVLK